MAYNILLDISILIIQTMIHSLMPQEEEDCEIMNQKGRFNTTVIKKFGAPVENDELSNIKLDLGQTISAITLTYEAYEDDMEKQTCIRDLDNFDLETNNAYMQEQVCLPHGEELQLGTILN